MAIALTPVQAIVIFVAGLMLLWLSLNVDRWIERRAARRRRVQHYRYGPQKEWRK